MFKRFYPDEYVDSAYNIDYESLYKKGYRGLLFDIDNTLVEHGKVATKQAEEFFNRLDSIGFKTCLISNNSKERVEMFNENIKTNYIYKAGKPGKRGYFEAMEKMGTILENTIFIGDQLFTDVWGAKRIGMKNYLSKPIGPKEEIQIVLKRYLERIVLYFYKKHQ